MFFFLCVFCALCGSIKTFMIGKTIYSKLYLSFLVIFLITLVLVLVLSAHFYGAHLRSQIAEYSLVEARFLRDEYVDNCGSTPGNSPECHSFLRKVGHMRLIRFGVVDPNGHVVYSNRSEMQDLEPDEVTRIRAGREAFLFRPHEPPGIALPVLDSQGKLVSAVLLQRVPRRDMFPRYPLAFSLIIAGIAIAIMVIPLSRRITGPVRELHLLARRWAEGHLEERSKVHGADEIGELGRVFNGMADNLQKMLQQKKEFLALISHELKSPVARMKIAAEILADRSAEDPQAAKIVKGIQGDLEESEKMIEQLLLISRIEMDFPSAIQERADAAQIVNRAIDQVMPLAEARKIRIEPVTSQGVFIYGDSAELQRAVANILENAVKFSADESEVRIAVNASNGRAVITVADLGIGIAPEEREKIFEPFFRGKGAVGRNGSGLGLFLARRIAERHQGTIVATANTPSGTLITLDLPRANPES